MTAHHIVGLTARLFAIWLLITALRSAAVIAMAMPEASQATGWIALIAIPVPVAVLLWIFPSAIAHRFIPRTHDVDVVRLPARQVAAAATAMLGLLTLVNALPELIASVSFALLGPERGGVAMFLDPAQHFGLMLAVGETAAGIFLLVKPWLIAKRIFPNQGNTPNSVPATDSH